MDEMLGTGDMARLVGMSRRTLQSWIDRGDVVPDSRAAKLSGNGHIGIGFDPSRQYEIRALHDDMQAKKKATAEKKRAEAAKRRQPRSPSASPIVELTPGEQRVVVAAYLDGTLGPKSPWINSCPPAHYFTAAEAA
jgi:hypothetical protein